MIYLDISCSPATQLQPLLLVQKRETNKIFSSNCLVLLACKSGKRIEVHNVTSGQPKGSIRGGYQVDTGKTPWLIRPSCPTKEKCGKLQKGS